MPSPAALALLLSFWPFAAKDQTPPSQFNLVCTIQRQEAKRVKPYGKRTLRVDLPAHRWCEDRCETVGELKVTDQQIELLSPSTPQGPTVINRVMVLNRASGRLRDERRILLDGDLVGVDIFYGDCQLRPYTGVDKKLF
jgi:hypothetical protein